MSKKESFINNGISGKLLNWMYSKAISGFGGADSAYELAYDYMKTEGTLEEKVDRLIKWQVTKAGTNGFITGLGGFAFMPIALPANIAGVIYIQIRMITAIAHMGGYDIKSDQVKSLVYISMVGNGAKELLKDIGVKAGEKFLTKFAKNISSKSLSSVSEKVGVNLTSRLIGTSGASKLAKAVPLAGGFIGGAFDVVSTRIVGKVAKKIFITDNKPQDIELSE